MAVEKIDLDASVYDLVRQTPAIVPVMVQLGLDGVTNPALLNTAGRFMTLRKGAQMKSIVLADLVAALAAANFEVVDHGE